MIGLDFMWFVVILMSVFYILVFGFLKNLNEFIILCKLGFKVYKTLPPGDLTWPLFGSSISFWKAFTGGQPESFLSKIISRNDDGGIYRTHLFGKPTIIITEREASRAIVTNDKTFKFSVPVPMKKLLSSNNFEFLLVENSKTLHKITTSLVAGESILERQVEIIEQYVKNALEKWSSSPPPTSSYSSSSSSSSPSSSIIPIEILTEMKSLTLKVIYQILCGNSIGLSYLGQLQTHYSEFANGIMTIFPFALPGTNFRRAVKAREKIAEIMKAIIEEKIKKENNKNIKTDENKERVCMLDLLMEAKDDNGGKLLEVDCISDVLLMLTFAGEDTTATTATWAMKYLTQHPQVFKKAKEEQELIISQRPSLQKGLTFHEIKQMKYLQMVINETLRTSNLSFGIIREVTADATINGHTFPKGWNVAVWLKSIHMNPQTFPNPKKFDPSRWQNFVPKPYTFLPFGYGRHLCCGIELAKLEITILLHHFLLYYKLEIIDPDCKITHLPFPKPKDNLLSILTRA